MAETRPFKPADGAKSLLFQTVYCENCAVHVRAGAICPILCNAQYFDTEEPEYPAQWRVGDAGPECAAFEPRPRMSRAEFDVLPFAKGDGK